DPDTGENCCDQPGPDGSCPPPPCEPGPDGGCDDQPPCDDDPACWPEPQPPPCDAVPGADPDDECWTDGAVPENPIPDFGCAVSEPGG
ncbi:MAG TPA: hypothetical protein VNO33_18205, partial [Kofleriaceae bacterium]|nr:hypothetical protein [Kofleriaceae bacterium]